MTTNEFIEMLKKEDPSGQAHVRMSGGVPIFAELKDGYWDGPYNYLDDDENLVISTMGSKVDIHTMDVWDFVEDNMSGSTSFDDIQEKIKFDMGNMLSERNKELRVDPIIKEAREAYDSIKEIKDRLYKEGLNTMIENAGKGWTWFQDKRIDSDDPRKHFYYTWKIYNEDGKEQGSNVNMTESIQKSGIWERVDNNKKEGYYEWIYKN